jgi:peptidoglycan/xylan/chitin deacetylase (PgdA/CDA1 family)
MHFKKFIALAFILLPLLTHAATEPVRTQALPGTVALTFDDGPSPVYTPQILKILRDNHIKATFFMMGNHAKQHPEIVKQVLAEGHHIENHTLTHPKLTHLSDKDLYNEVVTTEKILTQIIGSKPLCLRPPYGLANAHVREYIRAQGITPVAMGFNSFDYDRPGVEKIVQWVVTNAHSGQVFLMHDGYTAREQTVAALPEIIAGIRKKGLGFSQIC